MSLVRRFQQLPAPARWATYVAVVMLLLGLLWLPGFLRYMEETRAGPEGQRVAHPWQVPGYRTGERPRIWVDPETRCHYLIVGGPFSWGLVPRYDADGATLICNQPIPEDAK